MKLERTRATYKLASSHSLEARNPLIDSFLTQYLAIVLYAEMEEKISEIISSQLRKFTNSRIGVFLSNNMDNIIRRIPKSDISKLVGTLGDDFQRQFNERISEHEITYYMNIILARHSIGHRRGTELSFNEIRQGIDAAENILGALQSCFE